MVFLYNIRAQLQSCIQLVTNPWMVVCQASLSMGFAWEEYWSGLPFPTSGDLPNILIAYYVSGIILSIMNSVVKKTQYWS